MAGPEPAYRLWLWDGFCLQSADGRKIPISSRKAMALLAMLATAPRGERSREWLQDQLWGSRGRHQAQQSLRRELATLRKQLGADSAIIGSSNSRIWIDPAQIELMRAPDARPASFLREAGMPLEPGLRLWLLSQREAPSIANIRAGAAIAMAAPEAPAPPSTAATADLFNRPAVAVPPMRNDTGDPALAYVAHGLADSLVDRLTRLRWLPVIALPPTPQLDPDTIGSVFLGGQIGARYIVRGRLFSGGDQLRAHVSLVDADDGLILWSERFDLEADRAGHLLDLAANQIGAQLAGRIEGAEQERVVGHPIADLTIGDLLWRARWHMKQLTPADAQLARKLLADAAARFPTNPVVLVDYGFALAWDIWARRGSADEISEFRAIAQRAQALDTLDGRACLLQGMAEMWLGHLDTAETHIEQALRLNPSLANGHAQLGSCHLLAGRADLAMAPLRIALRLGPFDTEAFHPLGEMALANLMLGDHSEAAAMANAALARRPGYARAHVFKINALVAGDDMIGARRALAELRRYKPGYDMQELDWPPFADRAWPDRLRHGLAKAAALTAVA